MTDQRAGRRFRIRKGREMSRVFECGQTARDERFTVLAVRNGLQQARLGVAVSRRHGGAVRRNWLKRLVREAFRQTRATLPGGTDYVVIPRHHVVPQLADVQESLARLLPIAANRAEADEPK